MNITKTAETLEGLLDLEKGESIIIESFAQNAASFKENKEYHLILRVTRADAQTKEPAAEDGTKAAAGKYPAGIIIP